MPRRKAGQPRSEKTRSRSGCQTCRRRRIRCDERLPSCTNCVKSRVACERHLTLKWQTEYENLGLVFGRQGVWSKYGVTACSRTASTQTTSYLELPPVQGCHFVNATCASDSSEEESDASLDNGTSLSSLSPANSPTIRSPSACSSDSKLPTVSLLYTPSPWPHLDLSWKHDLLQYYAEQVCPLTVVASGYTSPLAGLLIPFASSSPDVTDAMLALATLHRSRREASWKRRALQLEGHLLQRLRVRLRAAKAGWVADDEELPVLMLLLCMFAIIDKCDKRWTAHLRGARELFSLRRRTFTEAVSTSEVSTFTNTFFAFQDAIGRTACGERPIFDSTYWDFNDTTVNHFLGCSPALVSIISRITELSRERMILPVDEFEAQAAQLEHKLRLLTPGHRTYMDVATQEAAILKHTAAQIVLHAALNNATPCTAIVQRLVCQILEIMAVSSAVRRSGYLWPLFVAAAELNPVCDELWIGEIGQRSVSGRRLVLEQLEVISEQSLANTARARGVIVKVWQARDEAMAEGTDGTISTCNDWERFVAPLSSNISLA